MKKTKEIVQEISDYVNTFNDKGNEFCQAMSCEHRTLQQSFTKLCLQWLEHCASDEYRFDLRNEDSHKISKELFELFRDKQIKQGFTGETLKLMSKPSVYMRMI
jgi:hypothetical protein